MILIETITKVLCGAKNIRVWKQEELSPVIERDPLYQEAVRRLAENNVNAVEVTNDNGWGYVVYKDWP